MLWAFGLNFMLFSLCSVDAYIFCFTFAILPVNFMTFKIQKIYFMLRYICNHQMIVLFLMKIVIQKRELIHNIKTAAQLIALADFRMQNLMMRRMLTICKMKLIWKMRTIWERKKSLTIFYLTIFYLTKKWSI